MLCYDGTAAPTASKFADLILFFLSISARAFSAQNLIGYESKGMFFAFTIPTRTALHLFAHSSIRRNNGIPIRQALHPPAGPNMRQQSRFHRICRREEAVRPAGRIEHIFDGRVFQQPDIVGIAPALQ